MLFAPDATNHTAAKLILIVEDDEDIGYLLVQIIQQQTVHRVIHHVSAGDALNAITKLTPHLFILDYSLPDMTGLELHDWLKSIERLKYARTILMSARNPPLEEVRKRGILMIRKPFAVTKLLENIETLLA